VSKLIPWWAISEQVKRGWPEAEESQTGGRREAGRRRRRGWPEAEERLAGGRREAGQRRKGPLKFGRDEGIARSSEASRMGPRTGRQGRW